MIKGIMVEEEMTKEGVVDIREGAAMTVVMIMAVVTAMEEDVVGETAMATGTDTKV